MNHVTGTNTWTVSERLTACAEIAKGCKDDICQSEDHAELPPQLHFFRGTRPLLTVSCPRLDRDMALVAARLGAAPLAADLVVVTLDAHMSTKTINPITGEPWKQGEMQKACDEDGVCLTDALSDCLITIATFQDGRMEQLTQPYHGHEKAGGIIWDEAVAINGSEAGSEVRGLVTDTLRDIWQHTGRFPGIDLASKELGMDPALPEEVRRVATAIQLLTLHGVTDIAMANLTSEADIEALRALTSAEALAAAAATPTGRIAFLSGILAGFNHA